MRSRSLPEPLLLGFGAIADGIWCGALAAIIVQASGPRLMAMAGVTVFAAALVAYEGGRKGSPGPLPRVVAVALVLVVAAVLMVAGQVWAVPHPVPWIVLDVFYSAVLVLVGIALGRTPLGPEVATRHGIRTFALLCLILAWASLAHASPWWATLALAVTLVASGLLVAAARYQMVTSLAPAVDRAPAWSWLLAVLGVTLLIVSLGTLAAAVLHVDVLLWVLSVLGGLARYGRDLLAYFVGIVGAAVLRVITWFLTLVHVNGVRLRLPTPNPPAPTLPPAPDDSHVAAWHVPRVVLTTAFVGLAIGVPLAIVALALRRFRRSQPEAVEEERESTISLRAAAAASVARTARRLRRFGSRRRAPRTPAELVRRRYAELERRLARAGHPRPSGTTVRAFLQAVSNDAAKAVPPSAQLAAVYERARYSEEAIDPSTADAFAVLARTFGAAVTAS